MITGGTGVLVLALAAGTPVSAGPAPAPPQLAASVVRFDPAQSSVTTYTLDYSVTVQSATTTAGDQTVLTVSTDVLFPFGSARLEPEAGAGLRRRVKAVPSHARVTVTGFTDAVGSGPANLRLSRRRAEAVAAVMARARPDLRLRTEGRGEHEPVAGNTSGADRARNRRVEVSWRS